MDDMVPSASRKPQQSDPIGDAIKAFARSPIGLTIIIAAIVIIAVLSVQSLNEREAELERSYREGNAAMVRAELHVRYCLDQYPTNAAAREACLSR